MPTTESSLVRVLKALIAAGDVVMCEDEVQGLGIMQRCYRLNVSTSVVLDTQHAMVIRDVCGVAIDDAAEVSI